MSHTDKMEISTDRNGYPFVQVSDTLIGMSVTLERNGDIVGGVVEDLIVCNWANGNGNLLNISVKYNGEEDRDYMLLAEFIEARIAAEHLLYVAEVNEGRE